MGWRDKIDRLLEHAGEPIYFFIGILAGVLFVAAVASRSGL